MIKKRFAFLLMFLFFFPFLSASLVSAGGHSVVGSGIASGDGGGGSGPGDFFKEKIDLWFKGLGDSENQADFGAIGDFAKVSFLVVIIILIYSSISFVNFPENMALRMVLSLVIGVLVTFLMTSQEFLATLQSYKALGVTLSLILPVVILTFFTFVVATKVNPLGILLQRITWIIFSVFLFVKTGALLLVKYENNWGPTVQSFLTVLIGDTNAIEAAKLAAGDATILVTQMALAIGVFIFFVVKNEMTIHWLANEKRNADIEKAKDTSKRAKAGSEIMADVTR